jgi:hypothetical protein
VREVVRRKFTVKEAQQALEVIAFSSGYLAKAVVQWDDVPIEDGRPGVVFLSIRSLMIKDADIKYDEENKTEIPYGYLTGME